MIAVDTSVVVRFLTRDDAKEAARAVALFRANEVWVAKTVLLEAEWVLRGAYRCKPKEICEAIRKLAGLPGVQVEDEDVVAQAVATTTAILVEFRVGKRDPLLTLHRPHG